MRPEAVEHEVHESEEAGNPTVISFDPGGTTGWSVFVVHEEALTSDSFAVLDNVILWDQGQLTGTDDQQADQILELLQHWDSAAVCFEDFQLRTLAADLSPVAVTAKAGWILQRFFDPPRPMFKQMPSLAMSAVTDERLRRWRFYKRDNCPHARDATRHSITFLRRAKESAKLRRAAWPDLYGNR